MESGISALGDKALSDEPPRHEKPSVSEAAENQPWRSRSQSGNAAPDENPQLIDLDQPMDDAALDETSPGSDAADYQLCRSNIQSEQAAFDEMDVDQTKEDAELDDDIATPECHTYELPTAEEPLQIMPPTPTPRFSRIHQREEGSRQDSDKEDSTKSARASSSDADGMAIQPFTPMTPRLNFLETPHWRMPGSSVRSRSAGGIRELIFVKNANWREYLEIFKQRYDAISESGQSPSVYLAINPERPHVPHLGVVLRFAEAPSIFIDSISIVSRPNSLKLWVRAASGINRPKVSTTFNFVGHVIFGNLTSKNRRDTRPREPGGPRLKDVAFSFIRNIIRLRVVSRPIASTQQTFLE